MEVRPRRILIVEDHALTRSVMARLVRAQGFTVVTAGTLAEARQHGEDGDIGFLISDLGLADGSGWELMGEFHQRWGIKGVAISGFGMECDIEQSRTAGFLLHLTKPIDNLALNRILELARNELGQTRGPG
jgi:CheY-like chemotaxis protein